MVKISVGSSVAGKLGAAGCAGCIAGMLSQLSEQRVDVMLCTLVEILDILQHCAPSCVTLQY